MNAQRASIPNRARFALGLAAAVGITIPLAACAQSAVSGDHAAAPPASARDAGANDLPPSDAHGRRTYLVTLRADTLVGQLRKNRDASASASGSRRAARPDLRSPEAQALLARMHSEHRSLLDAIAQELHRPVAPAQDYYHALNGFALTLSAAEAAIVRRNPAVLSVSPSRLQRPDDGRSAESE